MIGQVIAAFIGTVAFSLLFSVPRRYYVQCGVCGGAGWFLYCFLTQNQLCTVTVSTFLATVLVVLLSRFLAVQYRCPQTVFLITGIFPLVPGGSVYWTSYYLVVGQMDRALASGMTAIKIAIAIVLGIVVVLELPHKIFQVKILNKA